MLNRLVPGMVLSALLFCLTASAQSRAPLNEPDHNKPALFKNLPAQLPVSETDLGQLLNGTAEGGKDVNLRLANPRITAFKGKIVSSAVKFENKLRSVVIRLDDFNGATLTLSSSTQPDGTVQYKGRIISFQHRDLYELQKKDDQYTWAKRDFYELVNE